MWKSLLVALLAYALSVSFAFALQFVVRSVAALALKNAPHF